MVLCEVKAIKSHEVSQSYTEKPCLEGGGRQRLTNPFIIRILKSKRKGDLANATLMP